ncbi:hypothetical protein Patl1_19087 [Pistacia atlantica]|uniref:Uncharacterized protein n=1 Tax=Pistacia atlantica TaxID=434234 RepID=A0ACC1BYH0_9ROSI|nr:hypothetical protein Patl1_19087 [Pistacia atlantica]
MEALDVVSDFADQIQTEDDKLELPELPQPPETNSNDSTLVIVFFPCVTFGQVAEMVDEGNIKFRELQSRGFNPCLGWKRKENEQLSMRPPTTQRMTN